MITSEFVQKYLYIIERFEYESITEMRYKVMMLDLCDKYKVDPSILAQYNIDIEPRKINVKKAKVY
jgi:hypothetical protein